MPISLVRVRENMIDRVNSNYCYLCKELMNIHVTDLIVIKKTRKSRYAHQNCAVRYNWIDKTEIQKIYLVPITSNNYGE